MIQSMTAYAANAVSDENQSISIEIRTYNSRHLDTVIRLHFAYQPLEERIRNLVSKKITRGRVEIAVKIQELSNSQVLYELDAQKAEAYYQAVSRLKDLYNLKEDITLSHFLTAANLIRPTEKEKDMDRCWESLETCIIPCLDALLDMRMREGAYIGNDLKERLSLISDAVSDIEKLADALPQTYQNRLKERISALSGGICEIDPARIAQEAAFLADRSDISEEITRIRSHVNQFLEIMVTDDAPGRRLNFLMQELNREFNTIGSKATNSDIAHIVVDVKSELEKMREQIQNIE